ncbi:hypothetical protein L1857_08475 [Amycolatopsis thermalba]|uniref:Uncharacterized protein n=1 Tax=Amycolatopsis thermalba TaxID=944492 RepID=A0ABY4NS41_9PSEU|nr:MULTISPECIES: hypothetical protein [Amycolatopsis]UQS22848.1 hypothetical protein L1857_08475 [Amycolatopsis thermalba]
MTIHKNISARPSELLTILRSFATKEQVSMTQMLQVAGEQAQLLLSCLDVPTAQIPIRLAQLFPSLVIHYAADLPIPAVSFWGKDKRWHVHIRESDPVAVRVYALLHQLKHIIDHPLRRRINGLSKAGWERLAHHFAEQALAGEALSMTSQQRKEVCL